MASNQLWSMIMSRNDFFDSRQSILLHFSYIFVIFLLPLFLLAQTLDSGQPQRTVHTSFGAVHGRIVNLNVPNLGAVVEYLGIPYAMPPLGKKRFMPPNSAAKWSTAKDASRFQPVCIQQFPNAFLSGENEALKWMPESYYRHLQRVRGTFLRNESEDCLYLNLYVPVRQGSKPMPILVLVHGGSYSWGSGNAYNGSILASYGQMIVVTLNYRLGIFGFLSAGYRAPICRGNWALADIAAALEFLRQTVNDFGGNPKLITLIGWDTGAALVNLLMSSPVSAPAHSRSFQRAILLGGSALSSWSTVTNPTDTFFFIAESIGCFSPKSTRRRIDNLSDANFHDMVNCFMAAHIENITKAVRDIEPPTYLNIFGPSVDGSIVTNDPQHNLREHGDLFRELDLLVGVTKNEAFHLLGNHELVHGVERQKRDEIYRTLVQNLFRYHRNEILAAITDEYTNWQSPILHRHDIRDSVLKALGDGLYTAPLINAARTHARSKRPSTIDTELNYGQTAFRETAIPAAGTTSSFANKHGTTFMYLFAHETKGLDRGQMTDSVHNEDLPYILGYPLLEQAQIESSSLFNYNFGTTERYLSEAMMQYISNFVKSGDPTRPLPIRSQSGDSGVSDALSQLIWPPFVADVREAYVELSEQPRDGLFYRAHEVAFWTKFLPSLERAGQTTSDERHNHFPNRSSFYGVVRTLDRAVPFWRTSTTTPTGFTTTAAPRIISSATPIIDSATTDISLSSSYQDRYSTILSVTVAVGCALLILNILIFAGIYHQWDKQKRLRKRFENHHTHLPQSRFDQGPTLNAAPMNSSIGHHSVDRNRVTPQNFPSSGGGRMPPAPPPPAPVSSNSPIPSNGLDGDFHPTLLRSHQSKDSLRQPQFFTSHLPSHQQALALADTPISPRGFSEQEPLLNRTFISPTCPRHGKQAGTAAAVVTGMDEIQV